MTPKKKMSLWTLLGLVLPLGNVWGPYLTKLPKTTDERTFRSKLVLFELCLSVIFLAASIYFYRSAMENNMNVETMKQSIYMSFVQGFIIIAVALGLFFYLPSDKQNITEKG